MDGTVDKERQFFEVEALQSIYNEEEFTSYTDEKTGLVNAQFNAFIDLPDNFSVVFQNGDAIPDDEKGTQDSFPKGCKAVMDVKHLPPVELTAVLPNDYPVVSQPQFTVSCTWLSSEMVTKLCKKLDDLWGENLNSEILFIWADFLKLELLAFLRLENVLYISRNELKCDKSEQRTSKKVKTNVEVTQEIAFKSKLNIDAAPFVCRAFKDGNAVNVENNVNEQKGDSAGGSMYDVSENNQQTSEPNVDANKSLVVDTPCSSSSKGNPQSERFQFSDRYFFANGKRGRRRHQSHNYNNGRRFPNNNRFYNNQYNHYNQTSFKNGYPAAARNHFVNTNSVAKYDDTGERIAECSGNQNALVESSCQVDKLQQTLQEELVVSCDSTLCDKTKSDNCVVSNVISSKPDSCLKDNAVEDVITKDTNGPSASGKRVGNKIDKRVKKCLSQYHIKNLQDYLVNYNEDRQHIEFCKMFFCCNICYQENVGVHCTQFKPCEHTFCKECIKQYLQMKIQDGAVFSIKCPEHKCPSEVMPSQVRDLLGPEQFAKYDKLLLATTLETLTDVVICPRVACQYPASREPDEKMAVCPGCKYVFCVYCKMVYHGVEPCRLKSDEKAALVKQYLESDDSAKKAMEFRYGKKQLNSYVQATLSEDWINNNSQNCPHCNASIEKSGGCNKMVCWRCSTYFCWICQTRLDPAAPYKHYYDPQSRCRNQLFEGAALSDDDDDDEFFVLEDIQFEEDDYEDFVDYLLI